MTSEQLSSQENYEILKALGKGSYGIILKIIWKYSIEEIGEYTYYYLSMKVLDIKLNIVK